MATFAGLTRLLRIGRLSHNCLDHVISGAKLPLVQRRFVRNINSFRYYSHVGACESSETNTDINDRRPGLVIFDKNGTLMNFHTTWLPWVTTMVSRMEESMGCQLEKDVYNRLDICELTNRARAGLLAYGTQLEIRRTLSDVLIDKGLRRSQAEDIVSECWMDWDTLVPHAALPMVELCQLLTTVKAWGSQVAICTTDSHEGTQSTLRRYFLNDLVDHTLCGDDADSHPRPSSHNVHVLCERAGVSPYHSLYVGDSHLDMLMARQAGVGLCIGVLSGVGTRLDLSLYADHVVENAKEGIRQVAESDDWYHLMSPDRKGMITSAQDKEGLTQEEQALQPSPKLVIFDKDGTIVCFHAMWTPWAYEFVNRLESTTGLDLCEHIMPVLGYCMKSNKWGPGVFTEGTTEQSVDKLADLLIEKGLEKGYADRIIREQWPDEDHSHDSDTVSLIDDPTSIFKKLQENGIKVAVCTSDDRSTTSQLLNSIGASEYVDMLVCGNDTDSVAKPAPDNALRICDKLNVPPSAAVVVGDSLADMGMGRLAQLGATFAVLSGIGSLSDLESQSDFVVPSIKDILPIVISNT